MMNFRFCINIFERSSYARPFFFILSILVFAQCSIFRSKNKSSMPEKSENNVETFILEKYSKLLGENVHNADLYQFIDEWYATPHCVGGKTKSCIDCSGFSSVLYQQIYNTKISGSSATIYTKCFEIDESKLREGDFVFFKINQSKISHVGIYLANRKFVHASTSKGVIISSLDEAYYKKWFYKYGRLKE